MKNGLLFIYCSISLLTFAQQAIAKEGKFYAGPVPCKSSKCLKDLSILENKPVVPFVSEGKRKKLREQARSGFV